MSVEVLVADDEEPALRELVALLSADPRVDVVHAAGGGAEALRVLERGEVAVAFLDVHMPGMTGFDLARALAGLRTRPAVVFVTADDSGAVRAFDLEAVDYVLKPVRAERLYRALGRALASGAGAEPVDDETIPVTVGSATRLVRRAEVRWVQANGDYSRLYTAASDHLVRIPLSDLAERWADAGFVRVHRSYLVHRDAVTEVRLAGSAPTVVLAEIELPVSRRLLPAVRDALLR
ncbi:MULTISPECIES: LytTR family DNA-binding domain-containing protein [Microbacterium]|uniref:LytR/AlgR family response regulator transcription factor n=1 Tax=Microbacterium TaxID=33882 RepID=UPI00278203A2|nr:MULTISPECIES: LytTR family DNA-binding domain-containing protein [Microbacterium]MDQ1082741.1 DNA-binding LytR/AlgR family response regulator [Microbacterium sp. SORGH_AS_0344]MDQ1168489.1 DNA-binding LytR/AlgR family response regulator [Microbacterium proteolyticum]